MALRRRFAHSGGQGSPESVIPFPPPQADLRPVGDWHNSGWVNTLWVPGTSPVTSTGGWSTPLLDMRTDLDSVYTARENTAHSVNKYAGQQLYVQIKGLSANHLGLNLFVTQFAAVAWTADALQIGAKLDYTAYISTGLDSALLTFFPPAGGYSVRFWQLKLTFDWISAGGSLPSPLPAISVQGAVY